MARRVFLRRKDERKLSAKTVRILTLLTQGLSADDVMTEDPALSQADIAQAAREALQLHEAAESYREFRERIAKEFPRAYLEWSQSEDEKITEMYNQGKTLREIGASTQRHSTAIRSRLRFLRVF